jgi:hypothetical protein
MVSDLKPLKAKFSELMVIDETLTSEDRITFVFAVEGPIDRMPRESLSTACMVELHDFVKLLESVRVTK